MKKYFLIMALVLLVACVPAEKQTIPAVQPASPEQITKPTPTAEPEAGPAVSEPAAEAVQSEEKFREAIVPAQVERVPLKEFTLRAFQFAFDPAQIKVKKGDRVRITITSEDVEHGFAIREYGINKRLVPGNPVVVEFTADKAGTFTIYCSVYCGPGHGGMRGKLIVEE